VTALPDTREAEEKVRIGLTWAPVGHLPEQLAALDSLVAEIESLRARVSQLTEALEEIGRYAMSHSGRDGAEFTLAALYRIGEKCESALAAGSGEQ